MEVTYIVKDKRVNDVVLSCTVPIQSVSFDKKILGLETLKEIVVTDLENKGYRIIEAEYIR